MGEQFKVEELIKSELEHYPGVELELKDGGKHDRAIFRFEDRSRFLTVPKTPSDWRASANMRRDLKKTLKELGAERAVYPNKPRKGHWSADATIGLQADGLAFTVPKHSPLHERFEPKDPQLAWSFELRSSVTLADPPLLVLKRETIPVGMRRARMGMVRALRHRTGALRIKMSRAALPAMLKNAPPFRAVALKLYADEGKALVFKLPNGVLPTSYQPHNDEPVDVAPLPSKAWPESKAPTPEPAPAPAPVAAPAPAPAFPASLRLELPKSETFSIEKAIRYLNGQKLKLGNKLRFTINEGGTLSAVHRIE